MIRVKLNKDRYDYNGKMILKAGTEFNVIKSNNRYDSECYLVMDGEYEDFLLNINECEIIA